MNLPSEIECDCCRGVLDIEREQDIERLRQVARLQKSQLEHLIAVLARKCSELEKLKGSGGELQIALKLLEEAQQEVAKLDEGKRPRGKTQKTRDAQRGHGPTEQPDLPRVSLRCELDEADRPCPRCGERLEPLAELAGFPLQASALQGARDDQRQLIEVERLGQGGGGAGPCRRALPDRP